MRTLGVSAIVLASVACLITTVTAHTWIVDPPSHYTIFPRNAITSTPCDPYSAEFAPYKVKAGQEVTIRWGAMGHAGGYVRLSLAPKWWLSFDDTENNDGSGTDDDVVIFSSNVIKMDCYGGGDCVDCVDNTRLYGSKLVIPINLRDGIYTLQMWAVGTGLALPQTFSCTDLDISGGDDSITCDDMTMPAMNDTENGGLDKCWSCRNDYPDAPACQPPHLTEGGFGFKYGKFCFPDEPIGKRSPKEMIGFAKHELGPGDTLMGVAKAYQCCCTPNEIATATGWGDVESAIVNPETNYMVAGKDVIVPFFKNRRGCTPANPQDFVNSSPSAQLSIGVVFFVLSVAAASVFGL